MIPLVPVVYLTGCAPPSVPNTKVTPITAAAPIPRFEKESISTIKQTETVIDPMILKDNWEALSDWCRQNHLNTPLEYPTENGIRSELDYIDGKLVLHTDSTQALWRDTVVQLAYRPQMFDDKIFVNGLDLHKTLSPLLNSATYANPVVSNIVIDPGHGGRNEGAIDNYHNRPEKEYTLDWALKLKPLLETNGFNVVLTRTNDIDLTLHERIEIADRADADIFISLHFNSAMPNTNAAGIETYYLSPMGMPSSLTRGYDDNIESKFPNNKHDETNLILAAHIQRALVHATGLTDRGVRRARFMTVLRNQSRPAVLLEGGFLSNPDEAERINDPEFRTLLAAAVADAITAATRPPDADTESILAHE
ncbi:MAG: N-acetylmuramoyl-L-alanine amidase [Verrucomicrobia bacterium]|nr:N-acetylmuramoyl-L-alanine amidase [Verrucomicrobiota bacterium]